VFGNDWFLVPLPVTAGSLTTIEEVRVLDTFGRDFLIERAGRNDTGWNLFSLTGADPSPLFVPPTTPPGDESPPVELVQFVRDEMANLAWAIQAITEGPDGRGHQSQHAPLAPPDSLPPGVPARYVLATDVPSHWVPLAPEQLPDHESIRLRLVPRGDGPPIGRILAIPANEPFWLHEEEVPRAGVTAQRTRQRIRWHDGRVVTWTGRTVEPGRGEASSGLRFDVLHPE
jgi:hypothetical protein